MAIKTILKNMSDKDIIVQCDSLSDYTSIADKGENTIYIVNKEEA